MFRKTSVVAQIIICLFEMAGIAAVIVVFCGWWIALP
jgi:hypothetical protein